MLFIIGKRIWSRPTQLSQSSLSKWGWYAQNIDVVNTTTSFTWFSGTCEWSFLHTFHAFLTSFSYSDWWCVLFIYSLIATLDKLAALSKVIEEEILYLLNPEKNIWTPFFCQTLHDRGQNYYYTYPLLTVDLYCPSTPLYYRNNQRRTPGLLFIIFTHTHTHTHTHTKHTLNTHTHTHTLNTH
jgi:hypothetical protein